MYIKVTNSGGRFYVQIVQAFRDEKGRPRQRTVCTLGRLEQITEVLPALHEGIGRLIGLEPPVTEPGGAVFESARAFGHVWMLDQLWKQLGLDRLRKLLRVSSRLRLDLEALLRVLVFNRLCDPQSKLGALRWLETVSFPNLENQPITHQHVLRAMDLLLDNQAIIDKVLAEAVRPLVNEDLSVVFYDMTTIRAEGASVQTDDVRQFGLSKDGGIARQFMLGLVQTAEGIPLYHEVFPGNTAEVRTLKNSLNQVLKRFPVKRVIAVADRGLLSIDNLTELQAIRLPDDRPLEFILAVPGRRYSEFAELLAPFNQAAALADTNDVLGELAWGDLRLIVAHDRERAQLQTAQRDQKIAELEQQATQWVGKLDAQENGKRSKGRSLSDGGVRAKFFNAVSEAQLKKIIRVDLKSELFTYDIDQKALAQARAMDGKLLLVSNTPAEMTPHELIARYKSLADIERGFKVLKSDLAIGPVYHRLPDRIRAHAWICFIALVIHRVMRARLQSNATAECVSPARALPILERIQTHRVYLENNKIATGLSVMTKEQRALFTRLKVEKPTAQAAYTNL